MTVAELIAELQKFPPHVWIKLEGRMLCDDGWAPFSVEPEKVVIEFDGMATFVCICSPGAV